MPPVTFPDGSTPVPLNESSAEKITRTLTARTEWLGFTAQSGAIATSLVVDRLPLRGTILLYVLLIIHLALAALTRARGRGPFTSGPPWGAAWLASCAIIPVLMALLVPPGDYGSAAQCVQMCPYPVGPIVIFAFFPWGVSGIRWRRIPIQIMTTTGLALEPLFVILIVNRGITDTNLKSITFSALVVALAFLAGYEVKRICASSAQLHFSGLEEAYRSQHRTIHDLVRTAIISANDALHRGDPEAVPATLERLTKEINQIEYELSTATTDVNVLRVLRRLRDEHPNSVKLDAPPGIGHLPQPIGELIGRCARNLVANALKHGGPTTLIHFHIDQRHGIATLSVTDNGDGFPPNTLDNQATTLHDLRQEARLRGGDLLIRQETQQTEVILYLPLMEPS